MQWDKARCDKTNKLLQGHLDTKDEAADALDNAVIARYTHTHTHTHIHTHTHTYKHTNQYNISSGAVYFLGCLESLYSKVCVCVCVFVCLGAQFVYFFMSCVVTVVTLYSTMCAHNFFTQNHRVHPSQQGRIYHNQKAENIN